MKKILIVITVLLLSAALTACGFGMGKADKSEQIKTGQYQKITAEKAKAMIDTKDVIIVDVRTKEEYDISHIENSILIPNETIKNKEPLQLSDKSSTILIYCRSGRRSAEAAKKLIELGYKNVYDFGGIIDWPYNTVSEKETLT